MTAISQIISTAPTAPSRQRPTTFGDEGDAFASHIAGMSTEFNAFGSQVNTVKNEINNLSIITTNYSNLALKWAENPVDSEVEAGKYSAKHYSSKAQTINDSFLTTAIGYRDTMASYLSDSAADRDYVASQAALVSSLTAVGFGLGFDSDGNLFVEINTASNITNMTINSNGELIVTYA